jgi:hypothetical protein
MKGRFVSDHGNQYDNFQMMGYIDAPGPTEAVTQFFDQTPYPIRWEDVQYMWAIQLAEVGSTAQYGDYDRIYVDSLRRRWEEPRSGAEEV